MSVQIIPGRDVRAGNCKARRVIRQCTFVGAAVAIGICVVGAFGANLDTGNSSATAVLSRPAPADRWLIPPRPIDPPYGDLDLSAQRAGSSIGTVKLSAVGIAKTQWIARRSATGVITPPWRRR